MRNLTMALRFSFLLFVLMMWNNIFAQNKDELITPESYFGFKPGTDRMLINYEELIGYLQKLDKASPKLKMVEIGHSPNGKPMYIAFISSAENIANLDGLKEINKRLALDDGMSDDEARKMVNEGKVFLLATLSMHSKEVGPAQAAPLIAHELLTTKDADMLTWMDKVVYMMVPNHNPDGMDMVVEHYKKYKGTKYEGSYMPQVYHKYVGHDNNRDFVTLSQKDTKAIAAIYNLDWFPQVMVEKHQMQTSGVRYFVPPPHDPIAENIDAGIWNWIWVFGSNMITDMTKEGLKGITQHYLFDDYWPGATETCLWKNVIGLLTEAASVKYATPVYIEPNELSVYGKGLSEYKKGINMPEPWPGGWWRLGDIVNYEIASTKSLIKTAALHHKDILTYRNKLARVEVEKGKTQPPYYYILPITQHDQSELVNLVHLLKEHGVNVYQLNSPTIIENQNYRAGDIVVPLAQPFRAFIKEVMEAQVFPERHYTPGGKLIRPYDIASWSLPLHRGLKSNEINHQYIDLSNKLKPINSDFSLTSQISGVKAGLLCNGNHNESFRLAFKAMSMGIEVERLNADVTLNGKTFPNGSFFIKTDSKTEKKLTGLLAELAVVPEVVTEEMELQGTPLAAPRIALIETYMHDMDAGWTRFLFDKYGIKYTIVRPGDVAKTDFAEKFDIVIFPNSSKSVLTKGKYFYQGKLYPSNYPPEFSKGIDDKGMNQLMKFVDEGGIIISWGQSVDLFDEELAIALEKEEKAKDKAEKTEKEHFDLPFDNIGQDLEKAGLYCPGSLVKIKLLKDHPLTLGMPDEAGVFFRGNPVFETWVPDFDMDRRVIGKFPEKDILLSGYMEKEEKLKNKSVMIWLKKGKGQFVLFGFNPQFRASTPGTYKLLFNSLLLPKLQ